MSLAALLEAVQDTLRTTFALKDSECRVQPNAHPPATIGKMFIAVYPAGWRPGGPEMMLGLDEEYGVNVGITWTTGHIPNDRVGNYYLDRLYGFEESCRSVMLTIHQNWDVMRLAGQKVIDRKQPAPTNLFCEPLRWIGTDTEPQEKYGEWIGSAENDKVCAYLMNVYFGRARRMQSPNNAS